MCIQARPISTNPRSMEEDCECGLPSETCFTARRLEVVAVAGLLRIYFVVCFGSVWWDFVFFFFVFFTPNAHGLLQVRGNLASCTSLRVSGCVQDVIISLVCLCVCQCVYVTFVVFTDCESCTRLISTNPRSMESGEYGLTRVTFLACRLELDAVARLLWLSWCVLGGRIVFHVFFHEFAFLSSYIQSSSLRRLGEGAPTASQSAHRELTPTNPCQVYRLLCSHLRNTSSMASSVDQHSSSARPKPVRSSSSLSLIHI